MSRYHLSEAYADIYSPRLQEDFDDNLRFIDYMLDEDIEEVVESLFWEFRDYGHTIQESIDLLSDSASTEVINESLVYLSEALTPRQQQDRAKFKANQAADTAAVTRSKDSTIRQGQRKARIDGAISKVRAAWEGAKGGFGRAAKAVSSGLGKASQYVSQQREAGKAKLQKLMRTGANAVKKGIRKGTAAVERTKRDITGETGRARENRQRISKLSGDAARSKVSQARRSAALEKIKKAAEGAKSQGIAFSGPGGTSISQESKKGQSTAMRAASGQKRAARRAVRESFFDYDLLLNEMIGDLISEGYAYDENSALDVINSLSEDTIYDITVEYLAD
jgi:hypothetical protein